MGWGGGHNPQNSKQVSFFFLFFKKQTEFKFFYKFSDSISNWKHENPFFSSEIQENTHLNLVFIPLSPQNSSSVSKSISSLPPFFLPRASLCCFPPPSLVGNCDSPERVSGDASPLFSGRPIWVFYYFIFSKSESFGAQTFEKGKVYLQTKSFFFLFFFTPNSVCSTNIYDRIARKKIRFEWPSTRVTIPNFFFCSPSIFFGGGCVQVPSGRNDQRKKKKKIGLISKLLLLLFSFPMVYKPTPSWNTHTPWSRNADGVFPLSVRRN